MLNVAVGRVIKSRAKLAKLPYDTVVVNAKGRPSIITPQGQVTPVRLQSFDDESYGNPPYRVLYVGTR